jgi:hypothetical protein
VVSTVVSNGIVNHYRGPPCRAEHLLRRGDLVRDLVRAGLRSPPRHHERKGFYQRFA